MDGGDVKKKPNNSFLIAILIGLIVMIVGLVVGIILVNTQDKTQEENQKNNEIIYNDFLKEVEEKMPGYNLDDVPDITKADILDSMILEKIQNDQNYSVDDAILEYDSVYKIASGDLKLCVAMNYANFIQEKTNDLEKAISILNGVEGLANENNLRYYEQLANLYTISGDKDSSEYYTQKVEKIRASDVNIDIIKE